MKNIRLYQLLIILIMFGCSGTKELINVEKKSGERIGIVNENFDPSIFDENKLEFKKTISPESKSDNIDTLLFQTIAEESSLEEVNGFRVQICAVSNKEKAKQIQQDVILRFVNEDIYMDYHAPYYKIRVGNCLTRYEAEELQKLIVQKGFTDAWIVRTKVKPKSPNEPPKDKEF